MGRAIAMPIPARQWRRTGLMTGKPCPISLPQERRSGGSTSCACAVSFSPPDGLDLCCVRRDRVRDSAHLHVMVIDEDEQDWITSATSDCGIDHGAAPGRFQRPPGALWSSTRIMAAAARATPARLAVLSGPVVVPAVTDGARAYRSSRDHACRHGGQAVVTLDIDNERGWFENARVMATPDDIMGSVAEFTATGPDAGARNARGIQRWHAWR
jgi:hypothetical protein